MSDFISLKDLLDKNLIKRAKDLAWNSFSKDEQESFLKTAQEDQDAYSMALAAKCLKEAEDAFNSPGFISRADPEAYSNHSEPETTNIKK